MLARKKAKIPESYSFWVSQFFLWDLEEHTFLIILGDDIADHDTDHWNQGTET